MITRRAFLAAVRDRIAARVLCSSMLAHCLERRVSAYAPAYIHATYAPS